MHRPLLRIAVLTALVSGTSLALALSNGPPTSRTGAPAVGGVSAEGVCRDCHTTFPLNAAGATLEILDVPPFYVPATVYPIRVRLTSTFAPPRRWGFQITAVRALDGQGSGTFDITGSAGIQIVNGVGMWNSRRYVEHVSSGTFPNNNGPIEWSFDWQAPATDEGRIFFFAAGNAANNSGTNSGDHIYTQRDTTDIHPLLGVPQTLARDVLGNAYPNPFRGSTVVTYAMARAGRMDLSVFDAQGRRVRTLVAGSRAEGPASVAWDGRHGDGAMAEPGVYFLRLVTADSPQGHVKRVALLR
jgi:hypothetical protein